jgi:TonB family protein
MKLQDTNDQGVFKTVTSVSDSPSWFSALLQRYRERQEARRNPQAPVEITAERDPSALQKLVETADHSFVSSLRGLLYAAWHPQKIETSATPVEVEEIWSEHKVRLPGVLSLVAHATVIGLALIPLAASMSAPKETETAVMLTAPTPPLILPLLNQPTGGGGGGGMRTPKPPSLGKPPRGADKQLVPPTPEVKNLQPELIAEPTIVAPQLANLPRLSILQLGDPEGIPGPPSAGPGSGGGIGTGTGRGVGDGQGPGLGDGEGGGTGGGVFRPGGGVSEPTIIYRVEPQYSEEARRARHQGTVVFEAIVHKDGTIQIIRTVRSLGFGLDENAMKALRQWRFSPGKRNGVPVDVSLNIEVNFNLR